VSVDSIEPLDEFIAPPCEGEIEILYQDEHILLIDKPSGLLSLSGKNPANLDSVHYRLTKDFPSALLVHRLDFGTSGIMLVALSKDVVRRLNQQFSNREVRKTYEALLHGKVVADQSVLDYPISKGAFPRQKVCYSTGKPAQSEYEVLARYDESTRVRYKPLTGRTHQLRIHSHAFGHPILGCDLYGTPESQGAAKRLLLHASTLVFTHPVNGQEISVEASCPF